ncbi:hypothetical protein ACFLU3_00750 [Chloroflexota bacterium]
MDDWVKTLLLIVGTNSIWIALAVFLFLHPEKFERWTILFYRIGSRIASMLPRIKRFFDRGQVASSIQSAINGSSSQINKLAPDVFPYPLKIEWVKQEELEKFIQKGRVVVRLRHHSRDDKNIVNATLAYMQRGFLPRSKHYLDKTLLSACEFKLATTIFLGQPNSGAYEYFMSSELNPSILTNDGLREDLQMLEHLDSVGIFTRIFLAETKRVGDKLIGTVPTDSIHEELRRFAMFLQTIAMKGDEDVPLSFHGTRIKTQVVLVAKEETILNFGIDPYVNRVRSAVEDGFETIYFPAWGKVFTESITAIRGKLSGKAVHILEVHDYTVRGEVPAKLMICQSNTSYFAQIRALEDEVKHAMSEIVPEFQNGEIEIVSIARRRGEGCKIAVRATPGNTGISAHGCCIGEGGERVYALRDLLKEKFIRIIPWSDNNYDYIVNALGPRRKDMIISVDIDEESRIADVQVANTEILKIMVGKGYQNVKFAGQLTGFHIRVSSVDMASDMPSPEEELVNILKTCIPEINSGEIEIVTFARIEFVGARVIVRWSKNGLNSKRASEVCRGEDRERLWAILGQLPGEWINFHDWHDNERELIIRCLYPLKRTDIESVTLNNSKGIANIKLRALASPSGFRNNDSLTLTQKVTGWTIKVD